ncbi:hypothetical protein MUO74_01780, partial [Candidatus Bathyarchaeota archaeon]|nr:hypothetical protein [Candidatus Bathyarchaeota archaeon]
SYQGCGANFPRRNKHSISPGLNAAYHVEIIGCVGQEGASVCVYILVQVEDVLLFPCSATAFDYGRRKTEIGIRANLCYVAAGK